MKDFSLEKLKPAIKPSFYFNERANILPQLTQKYPNLGLLELSLLNQKFSLKLEELQDYNETVDELVICKYSITLPKPKIEDYCLSKKSFNTLAKQVFDELEFKVNSKELFHSLSAAISLCVNSQKSLTLPNITLFFVSHRNKSLEHKKLYDQLKYLSSEKISA